MTRHRPAPGGRQHAKAVLEPREHLLGGERADPRRGELDGQREPIETPAESSDRGRVRIGQPERRARGLRALDEQTHGLGVRDRAERVVVRREGEDRHEPRTLSRDAECFAARGEKPDALACREYSLHDGRTGVDDVLAVVEDNEQLAGARGLTQGIAQRLGGGSARGFDAERHRDVAGDERGVGDGRELDPDDAGREPTGHGTRDFGSEPRLAAAARAGEGNETGGGEDVGDGRDFALAPHEARECWRERGDGRGWANGRWRHGRQRWRRARRVSTTLRGTTAQNVAIPAGRSPLSFPSIGPLGRQEPNDGVVLGATVRGRVRRTRVAKYQ